MKTGDVKDGLIADMDNIWKMSACVKNAFWDDITETNAGNSTSPECSVIVNMSKASMEFGNFEIQLPFKIHLQTR